jgi:hypothetical protein
MQTFKISSRAYNGPKFRGKRGKKKRKALMQDGICKARLVRSGLWDSRAAKSKLVVYRVGESPPVA